MSKNTLRSGTLPQINYLTDQQNLIRGTVSRLRSRAYHDEVRDELAVFRNGVKANLLKARAELPVILYDTYLAWFVQNLNSLVPEHGNRPICFDDLGGFVHKPPIVPLDKEIAWIAKRLKHGYRSINTFRTHANEIDVLTFEGCFDAAIEKVKLVSDLLGESYWAIQLRIALEHLAGGLEQQKRYTAVVREKHHRSVLSYVSYYISARNEDRISWSRFVEIVEAALVAKQHSTDTRDYLRYRLTSNWPIEEVGLANVLRLEQSQGLIDLYETFVAFLQNIAKTVELTHLWLCARSAVCELIDIDDFRLDKLSLVFGLDQRPTRPPRSLAVSDALFSGNPLAAMRAGRRLSRSEAVDPWQTIYLAVARSHLGTGNGRQKRATLDVKLLLASILRRDPSCTANLNQLEKITNNLSSLSFSAGLRDFCLALRNQSQETYFNVAITSLNSPFSGCEDADLIGSRVADLPVGMNLQDPGTSTASAWRNLVLPSREGIADGVPAFARAIRCFRAGDPTTAILSFINPSSSVASIRATPSLRGWFAACLLHGAWRSRSNHQADRT